MMRGVQVAPGEHQVEFIFSPDLRALHVTFVSLGVAVVLGLVLLFRRRPATPAS
jgi:hypothetical protein